MNKSGFLTFPFNAQVHNCQLMECPSMRQKLTNFLFIILPFVSLLKDVCSRNIVVERRQNERIQ